MYNITFEDNTEFKGGNPENSLWNDIPDKEILSLTYSLFGRKFVFEGFEKYNHVIKCGLHLLSGNNGIIFVSIMGLYKGETHQIIFNYINKTISKKILSIGKEYNNKSLPGWKEGIASDKLPTIHSI